MTTLVFWYILFLFIIPVGLLAILLNRVKGKTYVIQPDGCSAKISVYPICLCTTKEFHRIWIKMTDNGPWVETMHDTILVEGRTEIWVYNHQLTFTYKDKDVFVRWGKDLAVWHD